MMQSLEAMNEMDFPVVFNDNGVPEGVDFSVQPGRHPQVLLLWFG